MKKALQKKALHMLLAAIAIFALASTMVAQQQSQQKPAASALVRLLQSKGILTEEEAALVGQAATPAESEQRLAGLLLSKGLITQEDYNQTVGASATPVAAQGITGAQVVPAVLRVPVNSTGSLPGDPGAAMAPKPAEAPKVIPAVAVIRVFPVDPPKREGLIPAFKLGKVNVTPYGLFKASAVYDSSSPEGNDFPGPGNASAQNSLTLSPWGSLESIANSVAMFRFRVPGVPLQFPGVHPSRGDILETVSAVLPGACWNNRRGKKPFALIISMKCSPHKKQLGRCRKPRDQGEHSNSTASDFFEPTQGSLNCPLCAGIEQLA